jgi:deoxyribodipyrimidine photolyase-related protein
MIVNIVLPNQLFRNSDFISSGETTVIVEETLFFNQFKFHKQKIAFHRSTMKFYSDFLADQKVAVRYINACDESSDIRILIKDLAEEGCTKIRIYDPCDYWIEKRLKGEVEKYQLQLEIVDSPLYLLNREDLSPFFKSDKKKFFQTTFYKQQRLKFNILVDSNADPVGGKWSFDDENRKKYPKNKVAPAIQFPDSSKYWKDAVEYTHQYFSGNYGSVTQYPLYPVDYESTELFLNDFFENRFNEFGVYEDAIVKEESFLNHSILTPMLNVGLITPAEVVNKALQFSRDNDIPINSTEGFVRQIIGWREFIRGVYVTKGSEERTKNYWGLERKMPACFYDGTTGILPIDQTIKKLNSTGYSHHIERLMVLGNFMLLCEIRPDEVYKWFMEMYVDAYDWVMVPNVYGMSQFADGGLMSTKPYISSSNYILKMSNYPKGDWQEVWDGLFWRFIHVNRSFFLGNPRLSMMVRNWDKMTEEKQSFHLERADKFLKEIHS